MTTKDYTLIARVANAHRDYLKRVGNTTVLAQHDHFMMKLASTLAKDNKRFDYEIFFTACGMREGINK